jgi:hypothetical protein
MKADFLKECHGEITAKAGMPVPLNDFMNEYCRICQNKDCGRSAGSNSLMFNRAINWQNRLFLDVKQDVNDPKYDLIRSKWFKQEQISVNGELLENANQTTEFVNSPPEPQERTPPEPVGSDTVLSISNVEPTEYENRSTEEPRDVIKIEEPRGVLKIEEVPNNRTVDSIIPPDGEQFLDDGRNDVVIKPGGSFTFGD